MVTVRGQNSIKNMVKQTAQNAKQISVTKKRPVRRHWHQVSRIQGCRMILNGACAHYVMLSKFQWKPFWLATQRDPQNDWTATQNRVNYDVFAQAPSDRAHKIYDNSPMERFRLILKISNWSCDLT